MPPSTQQPSPGRQPQSFTHVFPAADGSLIIITNASSFSVSDTTFSPSNPAGVSLGLGGLGLPPRAGTSQAGAAGGEPDDETSYMALVAARRRRTQALQARAAAALQAANAAGGSGTGTSSAQHSVRSLAAPTVSGLASPVAEASTSRLRPTPSGFTALGASPPTQAAAPATEESPFYRARTADALPSSTPPASDPAPRASSSLPQRLDNTADLLRHARDALATAVGYAERLDEVTSSLARLTDRSSHLAAVQGPPAAPADVPTAATPPTAPAIVAPALNPFSAVRERADTLQQSIRQLRETSNQLSQLLSARDALAPPAPGASATQPPSPQPAVHRAGTEDLLARAAAARNQLASASLALQNARTAASQEQERQALESELRQEEQQRLSTFADVQRGLAELRARLAGLTTRSPFEAPRVSPRLGTPSTAPTPSSAASSPPLETADSTPFTPVRPAPRNDFGAVSPNSPAALLTPDERSSLLDALINASWNANNAPDSQQENSNTTTITIATLSRPAGPPGPAAAANGISAGTPAPSRSSPARARATRRNSEEPYARSSRDPSVGAASGDSTPPTGQVPSSGDASGLRRPLSTRNRNGPTAAGMGFLASGAQQSPWRAPGARLTGPTVAGSSSLSNGVPGLFNDLPSGFTQPSELAGDYNPQQAVGQGTGGRRWTSFQRRDKNGDEVVAEDGDDESDGHEHSVSGRRPSGRELVGR